MTSPSRYLSVPHVSKPHASKALASWRVGLGKYLYLGASALPKSGCFTVCVHDVVYVHISTTGYVPTSYMYCTFKLHYYDIKVLTSFYYLSAG